MLYTDYPTLKKPSLSGKSSTSEALQELFQTVFQRFPQGTGLHIPDKYTEYAKIQYKFLLFYGFFKCVLLCNKTKLLLSLYLEFFENIYVNYLIVEIFYYLWFLIKLKQLRIFTYELILN